MPFIQYTRKRRLLTGSDGKLDGFELASYDENQKEDATNHAPLDGSDGETVFFNERDEIALTVGMVHKNDLPKWREFKSSTAAGETFTFDAFGSELSPDNPITVRREIGGYKESRANGSPFHFNISLRFSYKAY